MTAPFRSWPSAWGIGSFSRGRPRRSACWPRRSSRTISRWPFASSIWPSCSCSPRSRASAAAVTAASAPRARSSRPVADLRRSALALGRGQPVPPQVGSPTARVRAGLRRVRADGRGHRDEPGGAGGSQTPDGRRARDRGHRRRGHSTRGASADRQPSGRGASRHRLEEGDRLSATGSTPNGARSPWRCAGSWTIPRRMRRRARGRAVGASRFSSPSLGPDVRGVVIALNDVTDVSRAERVLAWGEMARQVAHEIKNPLTPMRLGLQHLRRVYRDRRTEFDRTLEETAERMLAEIDRLDTIARAFSRFAAPADDSPATRPDRPRRRRSAKWCSSIGWRRRGVKCGCRPRRRVRRRACRRGERGSGESAGERPERRRASRGSVGGAREHDRGGRRRRDSRGAASSNLRAAILNHDQRLGARTRDRSTVGGRVGRTNRGGERGGPGNSNRGVPPRLANHSTALAITSLWVRWARSNRTALWSWRSLFAWRRRTDSAPNISRAISQPSCSST